jgi:hypothetical protein
MAARSSGVAHPRMRCPQEISSPAMKTAPTAAIAKSTANERSWRRHSRIASAMPIGTRASRTPNCAHSTMPSSLMKTR